MLEVLLPTRRKNLNRIIVENGLQVDDAVFNEVKFFIDLRLAERIRRAGRADAIDLDATINRDLMLAVLQYRESGRKFIATRNLVIDIDPSIGKLAGVGAVGIVIAVERNGIDVDIGRDGLRA